MPLVSDYTALLSGYSWNGTVSGRAAIVSFSFESAIDPINLDEPALKAGFQPFTATQRSIAKSALQAWADECGLQFIEVAPGHGDIRFQNLNFNSSSVSGSAGFAYYPYSSSTVSRGHTTVNVNTQVLYYSSSSMTHVIAHEIGHAIGLKHPFETNFPYTTLTLTPSLDDGAHSIMSYKDYLPTLGSFDKDAVKYIYGQVDASFLSSWDWQPTSGILKQIGLSSSDAIVGVGGARNYIEGGLGSDTLTGSELDDTLLGGDGNDRLTGGAGSNRLYGGAGEDSLFVTSNDLADGGDGDDALSATGSNATLVGGLGNDSLYVYYGAANVKVSYATSNSAVTVNLLKVKDAATGLAKSAWGDDIGVDWYSNIGQVEGGSAGDVLSGDSVDNWFSGLDGNDTLLGLAGMDSLMGGAGDDILEGGSGNDVVDGGTGSDIAKFSGLKLQSRWVSDGNRSTVVGVDGLDSLTSVETLSFSNGAQTVTANVLQYVASHGDLWTAFGSNADAGFRHFLSSGAAEGRQVTFSGLQYIASYSDLIGVCGADGEKGASHYINFGAKENRSSSFDALAYIASYKDLVQAFGTDADAGAAHYIQAGFNEGRKATFDALAYVASFSDLISAFGVNSAAATAHFIQYGSGEGRTVSFDALAYVASYGDLIANIGSNVRAAESHFIQYGSRESRSISFDATAYLFRYADLRSAFGKDLSAAERHYIDYGFKEGRSASTAGNDALTGFSDDDILMGGAGNDTLTGGGGHDVFVFKASSGHDVVSDFIAGGGAGSDTLKLQYGASFDTLGEILAVSKQVGSNTVITIDPNTSITLQDVNRSLLTSSNFQFA